jgi:DNA ligase (NAD+)
VTRPEGDADARCTNAACPAQRQELLKHFGSKGALDIDGLGDVLARQLTEEGLVEDVADLFALEEDALVDLERLGRRSARNLLEEIDAARKQVTLPRLLFGLGIPHVGEATADLLARAFGSLDALLDADASDLAGLEDVGPTVAEAIAAWCAERGNRRLVRRLKRAGLDPRAKRRGTRLQDLTVVFTGELDAMTRDEAEAAVRDQGGRATSSVSSNTDYLVVGEDPGGSKREDARRHGTPVLDEREFLDLLGRG